MGTLLLIDGERGVVSAWAEPLAAAGHGVELVTSGPSALRRLLLHRGVYDAVLFDPDAPGWAPETFLPLGRRIAGGTCLFVGLGADAAGPPATHAGRESADHVLAPDMGSRELTCEIGRLLDARASRRRASADATREHELEQRALLLVDHLLEASTLARVDALTSLPNRRRFDEDLSGRIALAQRHGRVVSVALVDIDAFKRFNALHADGYAGGDDAIRFVADALVRATRLGESVYRYGGDEFAVLLSAEPGTDAPAAAARLHAAVHAAAVELPTADPLASLTVSLGLVQVEATYVREAADLLTLAARMVGEAKGAGGGCVRASRAPSAS